MRTSIKINDKYIQKILLGSTPIQRIYQSGSIVYEAGGSTPCFEVVNTISEASGNYVDVYAWDTKKWYKRNNLSQYEEYGVMPTVSDLSSITYYTGKLVILSTDNHEYKWNGSQWVDLGSAGTFKNYIFIDPAESSSQNVQYTFKYYFGNDFKMKLLFYLTPNYSYYSDFSVIGYSQNSATGYGTAPLEFSFYSNGFYFDSHYPISGYNGNAYSAGDFNNRVMQQSVLNNHKGKMLIAEIRFNKVTIYDFESGAVIGTYGSNYTSSTWGTELSANNLIIEALVRLNYGDSKHPAHLGYIQVYDKNDNLVNDIRFVPDENQKIYLHDSIADQDYTSPSTLSFNYHTESIGVLDPPVDYDTKVAPADNVHYNTLAELEMMECPWIGMVATIGEDYTSYVYTENGWVLGDLPLDLPYLRFTATENTEITFSQDGLDYSINGGVWKTMAANVAASVPASSYIIFKGECTPTSDGIGTFSATGKFNVSGNIMSLLFGDDFTDKVSLSGKDYAFHKLFYNNTKVVDATNLVMPATTLSVSCYRRFFSGCSSLNAVSQNLLPATTLTNYCYSEFFRECRSLTTSPLLPATNLAPYCYYTMFQSCRLSKLPELPATIMVEHCYDTMFNYVDANIPDNYLPSTQLAPYCYVAMFANSWDRTKTMSILPATTLASHCYDTMFINNSSITEAPILPAETLVENCYKYMFQSCNALTYLVAKFTTTPSSSYTRNWLSNITATFYKNPNATWDQTISRNASTVPAKWTITDISSTENYLKFTTVDDNGSTYAFSKAGLEYSIDGGAWTTLAANTNTPNVPKDSNIRFRGYLTPNGSQGIGTFSSSGKFDAEGDLMTLLYGEYYVGQTGKYANNMFRQLFQNARNLVDAYDIKIPYNIGNYNSSCYYMFSGCRNLEVAPKELKGDTYVGNLSFYQMFGNCPKLTKTPIICYEFPAYDAMNLMFVNDTSLSEVYLLQTYNGIHVDNLRSSSWLGNVAATGTFYVNKNLTWVDTIERSVSTIPAGWTIVKVDPNDY